MMTTKSKIPAFHWLHLLVLFAGMICGYIAVFSVGMLLMKTGILPLSQLEILFFSQVGSHVGTLLFYQEMVYKPHHKAPLHFNNKSLNFSTYFFWAITMTGAMMVSDVSSAWLPTEGEFWGNWYQEFTKIFDEIFQNTYITFVLLVILAPLMEEIIFRGIILKSMLNRGWSPQKSIFLSSLLFGLIHGNPWQFVGAIIAGLALGWIYYETKSLWAPIIGHFLNNLAAFLLLKYTTHETFAELFGLHSWIIVIIGLALTALGYYLTKRNLRIIHLENE